MATASTTRHLFLINRGVNRLLLLPILNIHNGSPVISSTMIAAAVSHSMGGQRLLHSSPKSLSSQTGTMSDAEIQNFKEQDATIKTELQKEAAFLTKSLYRTCLRSVRLIRPGNEYDEEEFQRREREEQNTDKATAAMEEDIRVGMFSMMPPVDREDELRSRAEYYHQYTRENFVQEKDCLPLGNSDVGKLDEQDVQRYMHLLKRGDNDRKWLLQDMKFPDPYKASFPKERAKLFEERALKYINNREKVHRISSGLPIWDEDPGDEDEAEDGDAVFDDDDEGEDYPAWFREKYPNLAPKK